MYVFLQFSYEAVKEGNTALSTLSSYGEDFAGRFAIEEPIVNKLDTIVKHCLKEGSKRLINATEEQAFKDFAETYDKFAEGECTLEQVITDFNRVVVFAEKNMVNNFRNDPQFVGNVNRIIQENESKEAKEPIERFQQSFK